MFAVGEYGALKGGAGEVRKVLQLSGSPGLCLSDKAVVEESVLTLEQGDIPDLVRLINRLLFRLRERYASDPEIHQLFSSIEGSEFTEAQIDVVYRAAEAYHDVLHARGLDSEDFLHNTVHKLKGALRVIHLYREYREGRLAFYHGA